MKVLILLLVATVAMANPKTFPTLRLKSAQVDSCEDCKAGTRDLFAYLQTPTEVTKQISDLIEVACPEFDNFGGCEVGVLDWWGNLNEIYFSSPYTLDGVCTGMGACNATQGSPSLREWNCETCQSLVGQVADQMVIPEALSDTIGLFQGPEFCEAFFGEPQYACQSWVEQFVPIGMPVIANHVRHHSQETCNIVYDGVC